MKSLDVQIVDLALRISEAVIIYVVRIAKKIGAGYVNKLLKMELNISTKPIYLGALMNYLLIIVNAKTSRGNFYCYYGYLSNCFHFL